MAEGQQSHQPDSLASQWNRLSTRAKAAWAVVTGLGTVAASIAAAYVFLTPHIKIEPGVVGSDTEASEAEFNITNNGHFSITDGTFDCEIVSGNRKFDIGRNVIVTPNRAPMAQFIVELAPGKMATRSCTSPFSIPYPVTYDIVVTYAWPFWWGALTAKEHFVSIRGNDGHINVRPDSN